MSATSDRVMQIIKEQRLKVRSIQYTESGLVSTVSFFDTAITLHRVQGDWELHSIDDDGDPVALLEGGIAKEAKAARAMAAEFVGHARRARTKAFVTEQLISLIKAANR